MTAKTRQVTAWHGTQTRVAQFRRAATLLGSLLVAFGTNACWFGKSEEEVVAEYKDYVATRKACAEDADCVLAGGAVPLVVGPRFERSTPRKWMPKPASSYPSTRRAGNPATTNVSRFMQSAETLDVKRF
jgi:hypothetical protein